MTAPAMLKLADLRRLAQVAKQQGVCIMIEMGGKTVTVSPEIPPPLSKKPLASLVELKL